MKARKVYEFVNPREKGFKKEDFGLGEIARVKKWFIDTFKDPSEYLDKIYQEGEYIFIKKGLYIFDYLLKNPEVPIVFPMDNLKVNFISFSRTKIDRLPHSIITNQISFYIHDDYTFKFPKMLECNNLIFDGVFQLNSFFNKNTQTDLTIHNILNIIDSNVSSLPKMKGPAYYLFKRLGFYGEKLLETFPPSEMKKVAEWDINDPEEYAFMERNRLKMDIPKRLV